MRQLSDSLDGLHYKVTDERKEGINKDGHKELWYVYSHEGANFPEMVLTDLWS